MTSQASNVSAVSRASATRQLTPQESGDYSLP